MSSKRSSESILSYLKKRQKGQTQSPSTEEIALADLNDLSTSSQQENTQKSPPRQASLRDNISSSSNLENFSKLQNQSRSLGSSDKAPDTDIQILQSQPTNLFSQISSLVTKCDSYCSNSSTPYHPIRESELVLTTIHKRIGGGAWRLGRVEA
jgi:hypothetical protein